jgi:uncharacterized membrane protein
MGESRSKDNFRLGEKQMHERIWMRFPNFRSDNLKSKTCGEPSRTIQNRKLMGIVALGIAFVLCGAVAAAQQPKKVFRIGYLSSLSPSSESARSEAIRLALREHGYIEGQNVTIESRYGAGKVDRATEVAAELERLKVDIIVVTGGKTTGSRRPRMRPRQFLSSW